MFAKKTKPKIGCYRNVFALLFRSSRSTKWRKASKCKLNIENLLCSIKLHQRRRECMVRQAKSDIAQLLPNGRISEALPKAKQIYENEKSLSAYDHVEDFCTLILQDFSLLNHQSDVHFLPEETKESMAGLIFAASRIGELKKLQFIRSLFVERFGLEFDKDCVDLRPGNLVSLEIIKILDTKMPGEAISPEIVMGIYQKYQTDIAGSVDSVTEESASRLERVVIRENSKFLHSNLGESQGSNRSSFMR
ncbi:unnamed protein product [Microthlaspi erraticum]|uniref:IST1-like protein n=1 Tax=Microthlaspi erraticum TaxID=1685480 RepID=A0A6D2J133_9BRAS|nr:unnamed protein product [Microthlaspi erraticum]